MCSHVARCLFLASAVAVGATAMADLRIEWGEPVELGRGGYARTHRLADGRLMAAYTLGGDLAVRFASLTDVRAWSKPQVAARH